MSNLLIVESPNKAKKIRTILPGWVVVGSGGHIRDLPEKEIGVMPPEFRPKYVANSKSKKTIAYLKEQVKKADYVVLATDLDREGEAIAWHLQMTLKLKDPDRATFSEITANAINSAIQNPRKIDIKMVAAQECRRVIDRIVGYTVSPAITRMSNSGQSLSAGRVQSVALRIIVEREREIENFIPKDHYQVIAHFNDGQIKWFAQWDSVPLATELGFEAPNYWIDRKSVDDFVQGIRQQPFFKVMSIEKKESTRKAPAPFTTSTLQQAASVSLDLEPEDCMHIAQSLFEQGLITYHRTDSPNLSDEAIEELRAFIQGQSQRKNIPGLLPDKPNTWKSKADAQEAHEAIRPTNVRLSKPEGLEGDELRLYSLIFERTFACQMSNARYADTKVKLVSGAKLNGKHQPFIAKARVLTFPGWMILSKKDHAEEDAEDSTDDVMSKLPELQNGSVINASDAETRSKRTKAPPRYTQAGLVKKLEVEGVGRPSTYASIMATLKKRKYVSINKKVLVPQKIGFEVIDLLLSAKFRFAEVGYTRELEILLDLVAKGKAQYLPLVKSVYATLHGDLATLTSLQNDSDIFSCPKCSQGQLLRRVSKKSKKNSHYWLCDNYNSCKAFYPDKNVKDQDFHEPDLTYKPHETNDSGVTCPKCGTHTLVSRQSKKDGSVFWGCSGFPKCKTAVNGTVHGPDEDHLSEIKAKVQNENKEDAATA